MTRLRAAPPPEQGLGTVTSVGLTMPAGFSVAGSPIVGAGTFVVTLSTLDASKISGGTFATDVAIFTTDNAAKTPVTVRGFAGQTATLQEWTDNTPTVLASIGFQGHAAFAGTGISASNAVNVNKDFGNIASTNRAGRFSATATLTANNANQLHGALISATMNQNGFNATAANTGMRAIDVTSTVSGTTGTVTGASGVVATVTNSGGGTLTNAYAFYAVIANTGAGIIANAYGFRVPSMSNSGGGSITTAYGVMVSELTVAGTNYAFYTAGAGLGEWNNAGTALADFRFRSDNDAANAYHDSVNDRWGHGTATPATKVHIIQTDSVTNTVVDVLTLGHNGGSVAANFGTGLLIQGESSTTNDTSMGRVYYFWATATHASRKAQGVWSVFDTAERIAIQIGTDGSNPLAGYLGADPVARQSITGSRGGNAALASLLTALALQGHITDNTTA